MLNIVLCDDNVAMLKVYSKLIRDIAMNHNININITTFNNTEELLFNIDKLKESPDIIYLDILMDKVNGIEAAKLIRNRGCLAEIIFLTSSKDYVFESFDVKPTQYLLKSTLTKSRFEKVFLKAVGITEQTFRDKLIIQSNTCQKLIPIRLISHFDLYKRVVTVHYNKNDTLEYYSSMLDLEKELDNKDFLRIHRSYLVNLTYIVKFEKKGVTLVDHTFIPIGRTYYESAKTTFMNYITRTNAAI